MNEVILENRVKEKAGVNFEWLFQLIASCSWVISVIVYGSYELGDVLQLLAASAWTVSNVMSYFNNHKKD